jgi:hypothetical protein
VNFALPCLVGLTLLVCGLVASVPAVVTERSPRQRPQGPATADAERLRVVLGPGDRWYVNGAPVSRAALRDRLTGGGGAREVRFLPSAALPMATVSESLRWLRQGNRGPVMLELLPPPR